MIQLSIPWSNFLMQSSFAFISIHITWNIWCFNKWVIKWEFAAAKCNRNKRLISPYTGTMKVGLEFGPHWKCWNQIALNQMGISNSQVDLPRSQTQFTLNITLSNLLATFERYFNCWNKSIIYISNAICTWANLLICLSIWFCTDLTDDV